MIVLKNARLIPYLTEGYDREMADIVIKDNLIDDICPIGRKYGEVETVDLKGKTVLPGMLDLHVHLHFSNMDFAELSRKLPYENIVNALSYGKELLRQGFTTVRTCGDPHGVGFAVKDAVARGIIKGPQILACGMYISPTTRGVDYLAHIADGKEELLKACREEYSQGADFLKYMGTGSVGSEAGEPGALISSREELLMLQQIADSLGVHVAVHCHGKTGIMLCAEAGIRTIEHASYIDDECIELIIKKGGKSAIIPTLGPIGLMRGGMFKSKAVAEKAGAQTVKKHKMLDASRAGVLTGWGTDVSQDYFTENPGSEFALRSERGYTNREILEQATINSAKIIGMEKKLGTIKPRKQADLVIIDGKPDEDISIMHQYPDMVFREGARCF